MQKITKKSKLKGVFITIQNCSISAPNISLDSLPFLELPLQTLKAYEVKSVDALIWELNYWCVHGFTISCSFVLGSISICNPCDYRKYGYCSVSLLLHWQEIQIATLLNQTIYVHKLPRYPFCREQDGEEFLSYWIKDAVEVEPPALRNPCIGRTPGTIDHKGKE